MGAHSHRLNPGEPHRRSRGSGVEQPRASPVPAPCQPRASPDESSSNRAGFFSHMSTLAWIVHICTRRSRTSPQPPGIAWKGRDCGDLKGRSAPTDFADGARPRLGYDRQLGVRPVHRCAHHRESVHGDLEWTSNGPPTFGPSSVDSLPCWQGSTAKSEASGFRCADSGGQARSGKNPGCPLERAHHLRAFAPQWGQPVTGGHRVDPGCQWSRRRPLPRRDRFRRAWAQARRRCRRFPGPVAGCWAWRCTRVRPRRLVVPESWCRGRWRQEPVRHRAWPPTRRTRRLKPDLPVAESPLSSQYRCRHPLSCFHPAAPRGSGVGTAIAARRLQTPGWPGHRALPGRPSGPGWTRRRGHRTPTRLGCPTRRQIVWS